MSRRGSGRGGRPGSGPDHVASWVLRGNELFDRVWVVVGVSLMWWLLTAAGLLVLGIAPASCAAAEVLGLRRDGRRAPIISGMWNTWRQEFVRANVRMLPLLLVQVGALATLLVGRQDATFAVTTVVSMVIAAIALLWSTSSLAAIVASSRLRRQDLLVTWRLALLVPGALPWRCLLLLAVTLVWTVVCTVILPLAVILGPGLALDLCGSILSRPLAALLAQVDEAASPTPAA